jgi:endoglucanase
VTAGSYGITARATDNLGAIGTSTVVSITVSAPPSCAPALASTDDGNVAANVLDNNFDTRWSASGDPQWIQFCLDASSAKTVTGVRIAFFKGNERQSRFDILTSLDGTAWSSASSNLLSSGTTLGFETFSFTARSARFVRIVGHGNTLNLWNSYTEVAVVTSVANSAPTVSITSPLNNTSFIAPATINISANASDSDGTISKVEFFQGTTKLGEDLTSPYSFVWSNAGAGSYTLTAKATDNASATTTSSTVNIVVNPAPPCDAVTASSHDGNVPANVLDNDLNTRWSASGDGQWIQFCLGSAQMVSGVQIAFYKGNERQSIFDILVSSDAVGWTTVATGLRSSGTSLALQTFSFTQRSAKYVRIVGHGNTLNLWNSYTEVKINSTAMASAGAGGEAVQENSHVDTIIAGYPNPADDALRITYRVEKQSRVILSLYSCSGNISTVVADKTMQAGTHEVTADLQQFPSGMLILKMISNGKLSILKVIKR